MTVAYEIVEIPVDGKPLGRHVEHDPRSRSFVARMVAADVPLRTLRHRRYGEIFDQGNLGSCTGNASAGACNTKPVHAKGEPLLHEPDAVSIYERATVIDGFEGEYPPDDTGSSGLAVAKVLVERKLISSYSHAFGAAEMVRALQLDPVIIGINWYEGMDHPTAEGFIHPTGQVRGGHELLIRGYVAARTPYVLGDNSWGSTWGPLGGKFKLFVTDLDRLLGEDGDATVLYA